MGHRPVLIIDSDRARLCCLCIGHCILLDLRTYPKIIFFVVFFARVKLAQKKHHKNIFQLDPKFRITQGEMGVKKPGIIGEIGGTMQRKLISLIWLILLLPLAGCLSLTPKVETLSGADRDAVLVYAEPAADNLLAAMNANDFKAFTRDFDAAMISAVSEKVFGDIQTSVIAKNGKYLTRKVTSVEKIGAYYRVLYAADFEKLKSFKVLLVFDEAAPHQISGLFFP
jgi:hypothetical protein